MSNTDVAAGGSEPIDIAPPAHKAGGDGELSLRDAARSLTDWRRKQGAGESPAAVNDAARAAAASEPAHESEPQGEDAGPEEVPSETQESEPEHPAIEPPRSWTTEHKERWASLPRETQEYLAERERHRDREVNLSQQQAAEQRRAIEAERGKVEQARQQYESALPILLSNLQQSYGTEFADIQTISDVNKLAAEDPIRYTRWDAHQKQMAAVQQEVLASNQRQYAEHKQRLSDFVTDQNRMFEEAAPEFKDKTTRDKQTKLAVDVLRDLKFTDQELGQLYRGEANLSLHDHRLQLLIRDAVRYRDSESSKAAAAQKIAQQKKPVPPVQRPGTSSSTRGTDAQAEIRDLQKQLNTAHGVEARRIAVKLHQVKRAAGLA